MFVTAQNKCFIQISDFAHLLTCATVVIMVVNGGKVVVTVLVLVLDAGGSISLRCVLY